MLSQTLQDPRNLVAPILFSPCIALNADAMGYQFEPRAQYEPSERKLPQHTDIRTIDIRVCQEE